MNTQEKIDVMQAFLAGKKIEAELIGSDSWRDCNTPEWNWISYNYRIKPAKPKKVVYECWGKAGVLCWVRKGWPVSNECVRIPELDKEITLP